MFSEDHVYSVVADLNSTNPGLSLYATDDKVSRIHKLYFQLSKDQKQLNLTELNLNVPKKQEESARERALCQLTECF